MKEQEQRWIDTHIHVSDIEPDGTPRPTLEPELLAVLERSGVDLRFLMSCDLPLIGRIKDDPEAMISSNRVVYELCRNSPDRFYGSCTVNPHFLEQSLTAMDTCIGEWGFVQLGEMLQYIMDYNMDSASVVRLVRHAVELNVPVQVHVSTSNTATVASSFGDRQLREVFNLVRKVPEARYVLAHLVGTPQADPLVVDGYLDMIEKEYGAFPDFFWAEIHEVSSPGVRSVLERVPHNRLLMGTDWTTRPGPPFPPYGTVYGTGEAEDNPYFPSVPIMMELLAQAGASDETIQKIAYLNAWDLYGLGVESGA